MEIKPIDLLNRKFGRKVRGYDTAEVDTFLADVSAAFEEALRENVRLGERVEQLESELARFRDVESPLNNALVLAQKTADDIRANAQNEADLIVHSAEERIATWGICAPSVKTCAKTRTAS